MTPLVRTLASLRRRAALTLAVHHVVMSLALTLWAVPILLLTRHVMLAAIVPGVAIVAACAAALRHTPSLRRVAARADSALALDDVLVTALQHERDDDLVARLVVRDAERRLCQITRSAVYPWGWPQRANRIFLLSAVAAMLAAIVVMGPTTIYQAAVGTDEAVDAEGAALDTAAPGERGETTGTLRRAASAAAPVTTARRTAAEDKKKNADAVRTSSRDGSPDERAAAPSASAGDGRSGGTALADGSDRGGGSASGAGRASGAVTAKAGGQGDGATDGRGAGADGARTAERRRFETAAGRAEAAMARDEVPPGLRAYVRAYFNAVRPR